MFELECGWLGLNMKFYLLLGTFGMRVILDGLENMHDGIGYARICARLYRHGLMRLGVLLCT